MILNGWAGRKGGILRAPIFPFLPTFVSAKPKGGEGCGRPDEAIFGACLTTTYGLS